MTSLYSHDIIFVLFYFLFYFSGLSNRILSEKYLVTGDWSQSKQNIVKLITFTRSSDLVLMICILLDD